MKLSYLSDSGPHNLFLIMKQQQEENVMAVKYVFVTGGVVSGLGKGITAASLGRLLKARGYQVTMQKFDPYINVWRRRQLPGQDPAGS